MYFFIFERQEGLDLLANLYQPPMYIIVASQNLYHWL